MYRTNGCALDKHNIAWICEKNRQAAALASWEGSNQRGPYRIDARPHFSFHQQIKHALMPGSQGARDRSAVVHILQRLHERRYPPMWRYQPATLPNLPTYSHTAAAHSTARPNVRRGQEASDPGGASVMFTVH